MPPAYTPGTWLHASERLLLSKASQTESQAGFRSPCRGCGWWHARF
jgi:hypothetical protein